MTKYAQVVVHNTPFDIDFTYIIPEEMESLVEKGQIVVVPFKNIDKVGFVIDIDDKPYPDAKPIKRVLDIRLPSSLLDTTRFLSFFYISPWSKFLKETVHSELFTLVSRISWRREIPKAERAKIIASLPKNAKRQKELLEILYEKGTLSYSYLRRKIGAQTPQIVESLIKKGYIEYTDRILKVVPCEYEKKGIEESIPLNIDFSSHYEVYVLNDLSFLEKVNFYIKLYENFRDRGSVLLIFPNQKVLERVKKEFLESGYEKEVFAYYSGLKKQEERKSWACIREGRKALFLSLSKGPFLPIQNLSLIIVDEEESLEYMTKTDPVYHLRKAALIRAKKEDIPIILEAPKPSLFSYKGLISGGYKKLVLKEKKKRAKLLPNVTILEKEKRKDEELSSWLAYRIKYMYRQRKKQFIFINRRGYSSLVCKDCGYVFKCPDCDIPLIYFSKEKKLKCPKCTYKEDVPDFCPSCGGFNLLPWGEGVEKIKKAISSLIPNARIITISSDEKPQNSVTFDDYDVIIGTSAAIGYFELSDIDFIGVLSIDSTLSASNYHASEDAFLFLNFLRLNMKKTGEIIVETRYPEHRVFTAFSKDDPESFYRKEILYRKELFYPPFSNMVKFILGAKASEVAQNKLNLFKEFLKSVIVQEGDYFFDVTGPYFSHKEKGYYFWELLFKIENYDACAPIFKGAYIYFFKKNKEGDYKAKVEIDPDIV